MKSYEKILIPWILLGRRMGHPTRMHSKLGGLSGDSDEGHASAGSSGILNPVDVYGEVRM